MESQNNLEQKQNEPPKEDEQYTDFQKKVYTKFVANNNVKEGKLAKRLAADFFRGLGWKVAPRQSTRDPHDMLIASPNGEMTFAVFVRFGDNILFNFKEILSIKSLGVTPALMMIDRKNQYMFFIPTQFEVPKNAEEKQ